MCFCCVARNCDSCLVWVARWPIPCGSRADEWIRSSRMKVVVLALSGDLSRTYERLATRYPEAAVETVSRSEVESGSLTERLGMLRSRHPDVFVIATERLAWQRGQNLFMLFGALAGAREVLMIDSHDGFVIRTRADLLTRAPLRLGQEALLGGVDFAESKRELRRLERAVTAQAARARERARESGGPR